MNLYFVSLAMTVVANIFYHIFQKAIHPQIHPLYSLAITYATGLILTLSLIPFFSTAHDSLKGQMSLMSWASFGLGAAIVLLELGFLLAYRAGWNMGTAALTSNVIVGLALLPIGILLCREKVSIPNLAGIACALVGLYLMNRR